jgi:hypothetical protein
MRESYIRKYGLQSEAEVKNWADGFIKKEG